MNPFPNGSFPYHLPLLSDVEELIISRWYIFIRVYILKGNSQIGYKGHCSNLEQDIDT